MILKFFSTIRKLSWAAYSLAALGFLVLAFQLILYAYTQASFLDEGMYSFLGYQFTTGALNQYVNVGEWSGYAPLSFIIPGYVQLFLGPGIDVGRYFSVILAIITIVILWATARRLGGKWLAAGLVWAMALSPYTLKVYSHIISEVLVIFFLSLCLFFILGEKRKLWQIITGSVIAGLTVMTRQTLVFLLPLIIAYIFWQYGKKYGGWSIVGCLIPIIIIHAFYWPDVLQIWLFKWMPTQWIPYINNFRPALTQGRGPNPEPSSQLLAVFDGFRNQWFVLIGILFCIYFWPHKDRWKNISVKKMAIFLLISSIFLLFIHAWGSIAYSACTFCFSPYITFFNGIPLLLLVVLMSQVKTKISVPKQIQIILLTLLMALGVGAASEEQLGTWILNLKVPRFRNGFFTTGWVKVWDYVSNQLNLNYYIAREIVSILFCLVICLLILCIVLIIKYHPKYGTRSISYSYSFIVFCILLAGGFIISPLLSGPYYSCGENVLKNYGVIGNRLKELVPPESNIYWLGDSAIPLLYLRDPFIHPSQIFGTTSFIADTNTIQAEESGLWNDELNRKWINEADYILVESSWMDNALVLGNRIDQSLFERVDLPSANPCNPKNTLILFRRLH